MEHAFLIYSSSKNFHGLHSYEYGFANRTYSIVGDKPFSRGDVVQIQSHQKESRNEYRINVKVLGDPKINSADKFDSSRRIELPTLMFLSSRIYLSEFCDYEIVDTLNARILSFEGVQQDRNKLYAVAALVTGSEAYIVAREKVSGVRWEWFVSDRDTLRRTSYWKDRY
jgi:hypothetical protein